jgi:hypothetical protein
MRAGAFSMIPASSSDEPQIFRKANSPEMRWRSFPSRVVDANIRLPTFFRLPEYSTTSWRWQEHRTGLKITIDLSDFLLPDQHTERHTDPPLGYLSKLQVSSSHFYSHTCYFVRSRSAGLNRATEAPNSCFEPRDSRLSGSRFKFIRAHASLPAWEHRCWQLRAFDNDGTVRNSEPAKQLRAERESVTVSRRLFTNENFGGNKTFSQDAIKVTFLSDGLHRKTPLFG